MSPKYIVELYLDGYLTEEEMEAACDEFIYEQLNFAASSVKIEKMGEGKMSDLERLKPKIHIDRHTKDIVELEAEIERLTKENKELRKKLQQLDDHIEGCLV